MDSRSESAKALVVNCSAPHYNLGARKLADWLRGQGLDVQYSDGDPGLFAGSPTRVCLSVIFSWHAPIARELALRFSDTAEVWCGGPGMAALGSWWLKETGSTATIGLDARFERHRGAYRMTFAARGCPVGCWFCIVPKIEGREFTLDREFVPAPILCDNNLSALPDEFQDHIIARYRETGTRLLDANSGFEPRSFTEATYRRWAPILRGPWRFAFDEQREAADVERTMGILGDVRPRLKRVYVLVGNEPIASCLDRVKRVIGWGGEPHAQFVLPLNWLGDASAIRCRHDWQSYQQGRDFCRWVNTYGWRSYPLSQYRPRVNEPAPFEGVAA